MLVPPTWIDPAVEFNSPTKHLRTEVLPAPLWPRRPKTSPAWMQKDTPFTAHFGSTHGVLHRRYVFWRSLTWSAASCGITKAVRSRSTSTLLSPPAAASAASPGLMSGGDAPSTATIAARRPRNLSIFEARSPKTAASSKLCARGLCKHMSTRMVATKKNTASKAKYAIGSPAHSYAKGDVDNCGPFSPSTLMSASAAPSGTRARRLATKAMEKSA
mmetsp:Transcript_50964/g.143241  ORF Transcript_50964/g.143241 Transcript_50964/m.143241 type:complete len:216 (-) Transcript_50964:275-922(-)